VRIPNIWKRKISTIASPTKIPCRKETERIFPSSQAWSGNHFQRAKKRSVITDVTIKSKLAKNAGKAWPGDVSGLT